MTILYTKHHKKDDSSSMGMHQYTFTMVIPNIVMHLRFISTKRGRRLFIKKREKKKKKRKGIKKRMMKELNGKGFEVYPAGSLEHNPLKFKCTGDNPNSILLW